MTENVVKFVVLTGPPGCGKTTIVKKVTNIVKEKNILVDGFFTEEIKSGRERTGFDVVLMNGKRAPLSRIKDPNITNQPFVGKYAVDLKSFESNVLPLFSSRNQQSILVLDEIGKMELMSINFKKIVTKLFTEKKTVILATVPANTGRPVPVVELIKSHPNTLLFTVNRDNRNSLVETITNLLCEATCYKRKV